jgi:hypothetical protein
MLTAGFAGLFELTLGHYWSASVGRSTNILRRGFHRLQFMTFFVRVFGSSTLALLFCAGTGSVAAAGHPISVTETQVFVTRTAARVRIKLFAEDLFLFQDLEPDTKDVIPANELSRGLEQHKQFLLEKFNLRDAKGDAFKGSVTDVQKFEIPDEGIPVDDLMLYTATYELEYPFAEPPEFLTLQQDISDENFIFPSEMKLTLHQAGTEMTYTESLKPGAAETLRFDWDQQQLSDDSSDEDWEAWFEKQREATLGITSYSSVYSFIYIEPAEVRHEVLIPLASLRTIIPMEHEDPAFIEVGEQDGVRELIRDWLSDVNPTTINGVAVEPEFTRIDFYGLDLKDFARQAEQRRVSLANGRIGVIMTYRTVDDSVRETSLTWNKFHSSLRKVQSVVFSYPDRMQRFEFSRFNEPADNVFRFTADDSVLPQPVAAVPADLPSLPRLVVPVATICAVVLALACVIFGKTRGRKFAAALCVLGAVTWPFARIELPHPFAPPPEVADTDGIFERLHSGAYRALDFGTEDRIYEALDQSVDGPLLETLYLQLRESLQIREQGGAVARVRAVEYGDGQQTVESPNDMWPGFRYRSRWTVSGTVEHWGHVHERQNQFAALFSVEPRDGQWKITDMQIEDQQSVATKTRLRKF